MINKITSSLLFIVFIATANLSAQTTWIVNNNPNQYADFTTLQEAVDGASSGDILMIQPSPTSYGSADVLKQLTIVGGGYDKPENIGILGSTLKSIVAHVYFYVGSEGSKFKGIEVYKMHVYASDITIEYCRLINSTSASIIVDGTGLETNLDIAWNSINNISINKNYIIGSVSIQDTIENCVISNNYIYSGISNNIDNSILLCYNNTLGLSIYPGNNMLFFNNIVKSGVIHECNTCLNTNISNNIASGTVPEIYNNQGGIDMSTVFDGNTNYLIDDPSNPAIGSGLNGEDLGMYGGNDPYIDSGIPDHPEIYYLSSPAIQTQDGGGLPVEVKVRTNN